MEIGSLARTLISVPCDPAFDRTSEGAEVGEEERHSAFVSGVPDNFVSFLNRFISLLPMVVLDLPVPPNHTSATTKTTERIQILRQHQTQLPQIRTIVRKWYESTCKVSVEVSVNLSGSM